MCFVSFYVFLMVDLIAEPPWCGTQRAILDMIKALCKNGQYMTVEKGEYMAVEKEEHMAREKKESS